MTEPRSCLPPWPAGAGQAMSSDVLHPRWGAWRQFDRLGIWNHQDRLARVSEIIGRRITGFFDLSADEAIHVTARLAEEPTPDVNAGV